MSSNLSPSTRALLDAAKHDGPSREKRAAMWTGITGGLVTQTPPQIKPQSSGASGSTTAATKGAFWAGASMKGAFIGALFGSAISIGVATFMLRAKTEPAAPPPSPAAQLAAAPSPNANAGTNATPSTTQNAQGSSATTSIELPATNDTNSQSTGNSAGSPASQNAQGANDSSRSTVASKPSRSTHAAKKDPVSNESPDDMLSREVALVAEARRELLTGDAAAALKSVRAARSLEARQLEPEEMSLEARALRQLGRDAEAERVEAQLRTMYPGR